MAGSDKWLVVVGGPTASGKTSLGIDLAQHFSTEIISADSRQFYNELSIGVAKPTSKELAAVPHHFIGHISVEMPYSAGEYARDALKKLEDLFMNHNVVVMVGGSGLFINAVIQGFHEDATDGGQLRKELQKFYESSGIEALQERLKKVDPAYARLVDLQNPHRVMRSIERVELTGKTHEERTSDAQASRSFNVIEIAIDHPREILYNRINNRVDIMMDQGLLAEVKSLNNFQNLNALKSVGYTELFGYLNSEIGLPEAIEKIKQNSRRYAKRQMTWFRNKTNTTWFEPDRIQQVIPFLEREMKA
ncbi:MAG: tRNA (adenosine(37)-N6)-dimethylallyltransferase MiaA [Bacteroidia bacterium]|nr:tRNA (adenosine(37)-N6)-dimethylallyltransferase MiaA [Bacteroidia bacterium]